MENKQTKLITLTFLQNDGNTTANAYINIPFKVSKIVVKQIVLQIATSVSDVYLSVESDLLYGQTLGIINAEDIQVANRNPMNNEYILSEPKTVSGSYEFQLKTLTGTVFTNSSAVNDLYVGIVMEFST